MLTRTAISLVISLLLTPLLMGQDEYSPGVGDDLVDLGLEGWIEDLPEVFRVFLEEVEIAVRLHDWDRVVDHAAPEHYKIQVGELGMSRDQYIKELMGVGMSGSYLEPIDGSRSEYPSCDRIREIHFEEWVNKTGWLDIYGYLTTTDDTQLIVTIMVIRRGDDVLLSGAFG